MHRLNSFAYFPGLYNFECKILSIIPPVLPILKQPGFKPPTVAGPMIVTFFWLASNINFLVMFSGIPSAMMAIVLICKIKSYIIFRFFSYFETNLKKFWFDLPLISKILQSKSQVFKFHIKTMRKWLMFERIRIAV